MKKVVFITNSLGFGGAEKMVTFVANSLCERGYDCCIINLNAIDDYINEKQQKVDRRILVYTLDKSSNTASRHKYKIKEICRIAKEFKADVLIGFTGFPGFYAKIVSLILGIPSIMSERGDPARTAPHTLKAKVVQLILDWSCGGVFQTEGAMKYYGKGLQRRGTIIPNPIFINGEIPYVDAHDRDKTVVSVGRLDNDQKRYDVMIRAFKLFSEVHPEYTLRLYGKGSDELLIKQWISEAGIKEKVYLMGLSKSPMQDIAHDGMFLITSDYEGISNALLEAMAVGLPCVSTDHTPGGARLLIQNGENGLLAPIGDEIALANAMCRFAEDDELVRACGEKAKSVTERFAPDKIIDMWEKYINHIGLQGARACKFQL